MQSTPVWKQSSASTSSAVSNLGVVEVAAACARWSSRKVPGRSEPSRWMCSSQSPGPPSAVVAIQLTPKPFFFVGRPETFKAGRGDNIMGDDRSTFELSDGPAPEHAGVFMVVTNHAAVGDAAIRKGSGAYNQ